MERPIGCPAAADSGMKSKPVANFKQRLDRNTRSVTMNILISSRRGRQTFLTRTRVAARVIW